MRQEYPQKLVFVLSKMSPLPIPIDSGLGEKFHVMFFGSYAAARATRKRAFSAATRKRLADRDEEAVGYQTRGFRREEVRAEEKGSEGSGRLVQADACAGLTPAVLHKPGVYLSVRDVAGASVALVALLVFVGAEPGAVTFAGKTLATVGTFDEICPRRSRSQFDGHARLKSLIGVG
jgi:hypothetical protein